MTILYPIQRGGGELGRFLGICYAYALFHTRGGYETWRGEFSVDATRMSILCRLVRVHTILEAVSTNVK